jgi:hypothetical protein
VRSLRLRDEPSFPARPGGVAAARHRQRACPVGAAHSGDFSIRSRTVDARNASASDSCCTTVFGCDSAACGSDSPASICACTGRRGLSAREACAGAPRRGVSRRRME